MRTFKDSESVEWTSNNVCQTELKKLAFTKTHAEGMEQHKKLFIGKNSIHSLKIIIKVFYFRNIQNY